MKYSSRFFLYAPLGAFLILFAAVGVRWWSMASALSDRLAAANGHDVMPGVTMHFASRRITGFPFSLDTQFHDVAFGVSTPRGVTRWHTEKFAMHALTYGRDETIFEAAGHQTLEWMRSDGAARKLSFAVGSLRASAILDHGALARFDFDLFGFGSNALTAQRLQFHMRRNGAAGLQVLASLKGARTPAGTCPRIEENPEAVQFRVTQAPALLLSGKTDWNSAVSGWRAAGGHVDGLRVSVPQRSNQTMALEAALAGLQAESLTGAGALIEAVCGPVH